MKVIKRKRINPKKVTNREQILWHVEIDKVLSKGSIITQEGDESAVINEVSIPTQEFDKKSLISQILTKLFEMEGISPNDITSLSAYVDYYEELTHLTETDAQNQEILDICTDELPGEYKKIVPETPEITANEIKCKGIAKGGREIIEKNTEINPPSVFLDISTLIAGITFSPKNPHKITSLVSGLGGEILNALTRGHGEVDSETGTIFDMPPSDGEIYEKEAKKLASQVMGLTNIQRTPSGTERMGTIPVDVEKSYERNIKLIGCDAGENGSHLNDISELGQKTSSYGTATLNEAITRTFARLLGKVIKLMYEEELVNAKNSICVSGEGYLEKINLEKVITHLQEIGFETIAENSIFIENPASFGVPKLHD